MIDLVAIDGPVGVGKSSVASRLAARLGWAHLDTGAMYRAAALKAVRSGVGVEDEAKCAGLAREMRLEFRPAPDGQRVVMDDADVTTEIRSHEINQAVSPVADMKSVREELGRRQRELGARTRSVAEGRDMATVVFPDARWKFFLDADPAVRAQRRGDQLAGEGRAMDQKALSDSIAERDKRDRERPAGALRVAADATILDTTGYSMDRVIGILEQLIQGDLNA